MEKDFSNNLIDLKKIQIDRIIHEPARLLIMTLLYIVEAGDMVFLQDQSGLSWGNLSVQVSKLSDAGYLEVKKEFIENKPHTLVTMTNEGRKAFDSYQKMIKKILP
jgi:DNA-binding MarR family transcriptional regulator